MHFHLSRYSSSFEPFKAAFAEGDEFNSPFGLFVDACYWIDIVINFFTGFEDYHGQVELEPYDFTAIDLIVVGLNLTDCLCLQTARGCELLVRLVRD